MAELPIIPFTSQNALREWLAEQHTTAPGVWLKFAKKGSGIASVSYPEAVDVALCYGWIDGQKASFDDRYYLLRFTPRRANSRWSQVNRRRASELIESGEMAPAGLAAIERAKANGRWATAYPSQRAATVPEDLATALAASPAAQQAFDTLDSRNRYAILYRIQDAQRPETRTRRIEKLVAMLAAGDKPNP